LITRFIDSVLEYRRPILAVLLLLTAVFTFFFARHQHNNHISIFFKPDDPRFLSYKEYQKIFGNEEFTVIALESKDLFSNEKLGILQLLTSALKLIDGVERVVSLTNVDEFFGTEEAVIRRRILPEGPMSQQEMDAARQRALANKFVSDHLITDDAMMTAVIVELEPMTESEKRRTAEEIQTISRQIAGNNFTLYCSGPSFVEVEMNRLSVRDFLTFIPMVMILMFVSMMIFFRQLDLAVLCEINLLVILVWGLGFFVMCGEKLNIITNAMGAVLLAISIADSVHILSHLKETYSKGGEDTEGAIRKTMRQVWFPCLFTSLTTGAGFASFCTSDIRPVAVLGIFTAIGVMMAFLLSFTFLPALMMVLEKWVTRSLEKHKHRIQNTDRRDFFKQSLIAIGRFTTRHKTFLFIIFLIVTGVALLGAARIKMETNTIHYLPDENPIKSDFKIIEEHFGGTIAFVIWIQSVGDHDFTDPQSLRIISRIEEKLLSQYPDLTHAFSVADYLKEFNQAFNANNREYFSVPESRQDVLDAYELGDPEVLDRLVSPDRRGVSLTFLSKWNSNEEGYRLHAETTKYLLGTLGSSYTFKITGLSSLYLAMDKHLQESQIKSFFIAFIIIFFMMLFVCRNFWLAVLSMIPNLFPIAVTLGVMGWWGIPLDVATTMIASVTIGIAVDDTIHFITWLRRNNGTSESVSQAVVQTFSDVGKPIVITSVLLFIGFFVLVQGSILPTKMFGMLTAFSMIFALIGDLFILSPLILLFKPKLPPLSRNSL
jgi:uncharacterized protein